ncbi:hypothetical protein L0F63_000828 [Massospora cicadina]|nr:hypothetical protein L0F63_000828 [Massospora cicadina]
MEVVRALIDIALDVSQACDRILQDPGSPIAKEPHLRRAVKPLRDSILQLPFQLTLDHHEFHVLDQLDPKLHTEALVHLLSRILSGIEPLDSAVVGWVAILPILHRFASNFAPADFPLLRPRCKPPSVALRHLTVRDFISRNRSPLTPLPAELSLNLHAARGRPGVSYLQSARVLCLLAARGNFGHRLTRIHPLALKHAILAKVYRHALPLAKLDPTLIIFEGPVEFSDYALYYFYAGLIHVNLGLYREASAIFEQLLVIPSRELSWGRPSALQVEAYYKYVLVGLNRTGRVPPIPPAAGKDLQDYTRQFDRAVAHYRANQLTKFRKEFRAGGLNQSGNLGLAKRCAKSYARHRVGQLPNLYTRLSLKDIQAMLDGVHIHPLENLLLDQIGRGELAAEITDYTEDGRGVVHLSDTPEEFPTGDEMATFLKLHAAIKATDDLAQLTQLTCRVLTKGRGSYAGRFNECSER